ncbi:MAG: ABC-F family ATP-binding cassette domain-containing protein, partial [Spirochaetales bacterium]
MYMSIIEAVGICKDFGGEALFTNVEFSIEQGDKIGLVGRNGSGKTTLLRILAGLDDDFVGRFRLDPSARIAYVPQKDPSFEPTETVVDFLCRDIAAQRNRLEYLAEEMGDSDVNRAHDAMSEYGRLRERYDALDGDEAEDA